MKFNSLFLLLLFLLGTTQMQSQIPVPRHETKCTGNCAPFTFIMDESVYQNPITITSGVTASIDFSLDAKRIPDQLLVTVNGALQIDISPGWHPCWGQSQVLSGSINVVPCDVVVITVIGQLCSTKGTTEWILTSNCTEYK